MLVETRASEVQDQKYIATNLALQAIDDGFQEHIKRLFCQLADPGNDNAIRFDRAMTGYHKAVADRDKLRKLIAATEPQ